MSYVDKQITCHDCGTVFTFTAGEEEQFASVGRLNAPKRCKTCRVRRKQAKSKSESVLPIGPGNIDYGTTPRRMYAAKCSTCGKDTQVPFEPRPGRPVYCYDCFRKMKQAVKS